MTDSEDGTLSWRELLHEATHRLTRDPSEGTSPENDARRIVEEVSGHEGGHLALHLSSFATVREVARFDDMVRRRCAGEPLQYVLGRWGFRRLDLAVDGRVLIPRPETEVLVDVALGHFDRVAAAGDRSPMHAMTVVDLGTGSGAIALSVALERPGTIVWGTDRSPAALEVARANLAGLGRAGTNVRLAEGSWFDALPQELRGAIDVMISNPPYVASTDLIEREVVDWEPHEALFSNEAGLADLMNIVEQSRQWLAPGGGIALEMDPSQVDAVSSACTANGLVDVSIHNDLVGRGRFVSAVAPA